MMFPNVFPVKLLLSVFEISTYNKITFCQIMLLLRNVVFCSLHLNIILTFEMRSKNPLRSFLLPFTLLLIGSVGNAELNINSVYEKFTAYDDETDFFGASVALHQDSVYAGAPGSTGIYICEKGETSCSKQRGFDDVEKSSMLGISMGAGEDKIFTCAPRTDLENFAKHWKSLGKI